MENGFIILAALIGGSYQPTFFEDEKLMFFKTKDEAQKEVDEHIVDIEEAVREGNMDEDSLATQDDYLIVPATKEGTTINCEVEGIQYTMQETDDDYTEI